MSGEAYSGDVGDFYREDLEGQAFGHLPLLESRISHKGDKCLLTLPDGQEIDLNDGRMVGIKPPGARRGRNLALDRACLIITYEFTGFTHPYYGA